MRREQNKSSDIRKDLEWSGNERKDNLRWGEGRGDERRGQMSGKMEKKKKEREGKRGEGSQARENELAKWLRPNRQKAVFWGVRGASLSAERAQRVHLDGANLPLMLSPAWPIGRTRATAIFNDPLFQGSALRCRGQFYSYLLPFSLGKSTALLSPKTPSLPKAGVQQDALPPRGSWQGWKKTLWAGWAPSPPRSDRRFILHRRLFLYVFSQCLGQLSPGF